MKHKKILSSFLSTTCIISALTNQNISLKPKAVILGEKIANNNTKNLLEQIENSGRINKEYIFNVLNLQKTYMSLRSGVFEDFRFFGGNETKLKHENYKRIYAKDQGRGSTNVCRSLFPSPAGTFCAQGGDSEEHNFSRDLGDDLSSNLIAKIIGVCYKYRYDENFKNNVNPLIESFENSKDISYQKIDCTIFDAKKIMDFKTRLSKQANKACNDLNLDEKIQKIQAIIDGLLSGNKLNKVGQNVFSKQNTLLENIKANNSSIDKTQIILGVIRELNKCIFSKQRCKEEHEKLLKLQESMEVKIKVTIDENKELSLLQSQGFISRKDIEALERGNLDAIKKVLSYKDRFNQQDSVYADKMKDFFSQELGTTNFSNKSFATVLNLVLNMLYAIKNQEKSDGNPDKFFPKYSTEQILLSYFIKEFNEEDIEKFYNQILSDFKNCPYRGNYSNFSHEEKHEFEETNKLINLVSSIKSLSPYREDLCENKRIPSFKPTENGNYIIDQYPSFHDCVETAIMHTTNLLFYSKNGSWEFFNNQSLLPNEEVLNRLLEESKKSKDFAQLPRLPLKERLSLFYHCVKNRENLDNFTQSYNGKIIWNYVISNMQTAESEEVYPLLYDNGTPGFRNNELCSSFLNFLKFSYNVAFALKEELGVAKEIQEVKKYFDGFIEKVIGGFSPSKEELETITTMIYRLINDKVSVQLSGVKYDKGTPTQISCNADFMVTHDGYKDLIFKNKILPGHSRTECDFDITLDENAYDAAKNTNAQLPFIFLKKMSRKTKIPSDLDIGSFEMFHSGLHDISKSFYRDRNKEYLYKSTFLRSITDQDLEDVDILLRFLRKDSSISSDTNYFNVVETEVLKEKIRRFYSSAYCPKSKKDEIKAALKQAYTEGNLDEDCLFSIIGEEIEDWTVEQKLPNNVLRIPERAKSLTISEEVFKGCDTIETLIFPDNVQKIKIKKGAFRSCSKLKQIKFPPSCTSLTVEESAFESCGSLKEVIFPENLSVLRVGNSAFRCCQGLENIIISGTSPCEVELCSQAFECCDNLKEVIFSENLDVLKIGNSAFRYCKKLEAAKFSKDLKELNICDLAFESCDNLKEVIFPENLSGLRVGNSAFRCCQGLENVIISGTSSCDVELCSQAFECCDNLKEVRFFKNKADRFTIGDKTFAGCKNLNKVIFPVEIENELKVEDCAFYSCENLKRIEFPLTAKNLSIASKGFGLCKNLEEIDFFEVTGNLVLAGDAFCSCENLEKVNFNRALGTFETTRGLDFKNLKIKNIKLPRKTKKLVTDYESLTKINFKGKKSNKYLVETELEIKRIPDSIPQTERQAAVAKLFEDVQNLTISGYAFRKYKNLQEVEFVNGVKKINIKGGSFSECDNLKSINFPESLEELTIGQGALCEFLKDDKKINFPKNIKKLNVTYEDLKNFNIPEHLEVNILKSEGPYSCFSAPEKISFPAIENLTIKGFQYSCSYYGNGIENVKEFEFSEGTKKITIDRSALAHMKDLEKISLPDSLEELTISEESFYEDNDVEFNLPKNIKKINIIRRYRPVPVTMNQEELLKILSAKENRVLVFRTNGILE